jgi:phage terminase large subunit
MEKLEILKAENNFTIANSNAINILTGSEIMFRGIRTSSGNQTSKLKSLAGITTWVLEEAEEMDNEDEFDKIDQSVRQKNNQNRIILVMNPATKEHWIYQRFFEQAGVQPGFNGIKDDTCYIHTTYLDNAENLNPSIINQYNLMKARNPKKYEHQVMGGWIDRAEGVVFEHWEFGKFDDSIPFIFGQDFGYSVDPTTLIKVAIDQKRKVIYLHECLYRTGMSTDMIAFENKEHAQQSLIVGDSAEPRLIAELKAKGCRMVAAIKGPDSVRSGLMKMRDYKLIVSPTSRNIGKELNNYVWDDKKSNVPIDDYNHTIDAARYAFDRLSRKREFVAV